MWKKPYQIQAIEKYFFEHFPFSETGNAIQETKSCAEMCFICIMKSENPTVVTTNKKAGFEYFLTEFYEAGIQLTGTEIKSIRNNEVNLSDSYCVFIDGELYLKHMHISQYKEGTYNNHEPKRDRKLLLNKNELKKIQNKAKERGVTIVPVRVYLNEKGYAKIEIALARGKKKYDKREDIKSRDAKREVQRAMKR